MIGRIGSGRGEIHPRHIVPPRVGAKVFAGEGEGRYSITMQMLVPFRDPLALTAGLPARLVLSGGLVAVIWAMVAWAW